MRTTMRARLGFAVLTSIALAWPSASSAQSWSFPGLGNAEFAAIAAGGPAPRRDLTGAWDPGQAGIAGGDNYFNSRTVPLPDMMSSDISLPAACRAA